MSAAVEREIARYRWLGTSEIAELHGVSNDTVLGWIHQPGGLKAMNIGTQKQPVYRVKPEWLEAFVAGRIKNG